jgi:hypothetical protein
MDEKALEMASAAFGVLFVIFFAVLELFHDRLLPQVAGASGLGGSTVLAVAGFVLVVIGVLHRSTRD